MVKRYEIQWRIDDTQAQAVFRNATRNVEAVERAMAKVGTAVERSQAQAAKATEAGVAKRVASEQAAVAKIDIGLYKVVASQLKATTEREKIEQRWQVRDYKARVKAERDKQALADFARSRNEKQIRDLETLESSYIARDYQRRVAHERRLENLEAGPNGRLARVRRRMLTEEEIEGAARNRAVDVLNKKLVDARLAQDGLNDSFAEGIAQGIGLSGAATKAGIALMGIVAAKEGLSAVARALFDARKASEDMATGMLEFMVQLRPLASVMGKRPTREFALEIAEFGKQAAMPKEQAARYLETFAGASALQRGKQISEAEYEKFALKSAQLATARGIPEEQAADLFAGVLKVENFLSKGAGANEALNRANQIFDILDRGKGLIKDLAPAATELMNTLASENELEGVFRNAAEAAVLTSVIAESHPKEAAVFARAGIRALSKFQDKDRLAFYKRAGITPGQPALERFQRANKVFEEETAKGVPMESVLLKFGLASEEREKAALLTAFQARKTTLPSQMERMRQLEGPAAAAATEKLIKERLGEEDVRFTAGQAAVGRAKLQAESIPLKLAKQRAEAELIREGIDTTFTGQLGQTVGTALTLGLKSGREMQIETRALRNAQIAAGQTPNVTGGQIIFGNNAREIERLMMQIEKNTRPNQAGVAPALPAVAPAPAPLPGAAPAAALRP